MSGVNKAIIVGNLGKDPDMKYTADGKPIANITVATSETWNDKQSGEKKEKTEWHRVVFFGKLAEIAEKWLGKGSQVYVEGKIQTRKWQDKDGADRYTTEIVGQNMTMLGGKVSNEPQQTSKQHGFRDETATSPHNGTPDIDDSDFPF